MLTKYCTDKEIETAKDWNSTICKSNEGYLRGIDNAFDICIKNSININLLSFIMMYHYYCLLLSWPCCVSMSIWVKVLKNRSNKNCGRHHLKNLKWHCLSKHLMLIWCVPSPLRFLNDGQGVIVVLDAFAIKENAISDEDKTV